jgi:hypothetical protein
VSSFRPYDVVDVGDEVDAYCVVMEGYDWFLFDEVHWRMNPMLNLSSRQCSHQPSYENVVVMYAYE